LSSAGRASSVKILVSGWGILASLSTALVAQVPDSSVADLSTLDLEELAHVRVTSAARRPETLGNSSAAITLISHEDIRRSGAANLPEALRLLPGLAVFQAGTRDWAVSARGFHQQSSNKMLVLIDGRVIYSPIFAGVFWEMQRVPLEDVDRIELIRGPGAALWGANAVNGVINVVTRPAGETAGGFAAATAGSNDQAQVDLRYGGGAGQRGAARAYALASTEGASDRPAGGSSADDWQFGQGGFRADFNQGDNLFTVQGDGYVGGGGQQLVLPAPAPPFVSLVREDLDGHGGNFLGRWSRRFSIRSEFALQAYADYAVRRQPSQFGRIGVTTIDFDFQHHFGLGRRHDILWGLGYRLISDEVSGAFPVAFDPSKRDINLVTGFVQDEVAVIRERLALNLGAKFEHNSYTGFELQPTARLLWTPSLNTTVWAAVSRAVRTPSRIDSDLRLVAQVIDAPPITRIEALGSDTLEAEALIAYEAGYRVVPHAHLSLDVSAYYHDYNRLRSLAPGPPVLDGSVVVVPFIVGNDAHARSYGGTASATVRASSRWGIRASYTYLNMTAGVDQDALPGTIADVNPGLNPSHHLSVWSSLELPWNLELDVIGRYVSELEGTDAAGDEVDEYVQADARLGLALTPSVRFELIGRDLLSRRRIEFFQSAATPGRGGAIERQVRAKLSWTF
jgi:iron complex outermembrane recepter protein